MQKFFLISALLISVQIVLALALFEQLSPYFNAIDVRIVWGFLISISLLALAAGIKSFSSMETSFGGIVCIAGSIILVIFYATLIYIISAI